MGPGVQNGGSALTAPEKEDKPVLKKNLLFILLALAAAAAVGLVIFRRERHG